MPFISVVIPLYNKERDIKNTLDSVFAQSFTDFDVIVVNDGSIDKGPKIVQSIKDKRLHYYSTPNQGAAKARNYGVSKSNSKYIAFIDADDYWYPNHLTGLIETIKTCHSCRWFASAYELNHNSRLTLPMKSPPMQNGSNWIGVIDNYFDNSWQDSMACTSSVCLEKSFFAELGGFNSKFDTGQDTDLWIRSALMSKLGFNTNITSRYCLQASNRLTHVDTKKKRHLTFDQYSIYEASDKSLKKYLDLIRYSYVIKFKIAKCKETWVQLKRDIDIKNLSIIQRILLNTPGSLINHMLAIKKIAEKIGLRIRSRQ